MVDDAYKQSKHTLQNSMTPDEIMRNQQTQFRALVQEYADQHGLSFEEARRERAIKLQADYAAARMATRKELTEFHGHYNQEWEDVL